MQIGDRIKVIGQEIYGKIIYDYGTEVVIEDEDAETCDNTLYFKKSEVEEIITNNGGKPSRLNNSTNYLVIGAYATDSWAHSSYGRKIEKALTIKQKGIDIKIISEHHLLKFLK